MFERFQFDFSDLTMGEVLSLSVVVHTDEEIRQRIHIVNKCVVGGIEQLPVLDLPQLMDEFQMAFNIWFGHVISQYKEETND